MTYRWNGARVRGSWLKHGLLEGVETLSGARSVSSLKTRASNAVRILDEADCFDLNQPVLQSMATSLKKYPLLTDKQVDFAASLILKANLTDTLAIALNELQDAGVDIHARYVPTATPGGYSADESDIPFDDRVEIRRVPSPVKPKEPELEVDLITHPLWGMF